MTGGQISSAPANDAPTSSVSITLLGTTDTHGRIEPWDYYADKQANLGLANIAILIKQQRAEAPDAVLLDCGDTIQGTLLAYYFAEKDTSKPNPMIAAFNPLRSDAMAAGNHEFNFGEENDVEGDGRITVPLARRKYQKAALEHAAVANTGAQSK
jgi:2',3'-cyclic-nucleotide 2'-phosphodiesterase / 3'-nucleotidase